MLKLQLKPKLIRAGAGTGKTAALVEEVYGLFQSFRRVEKRDPRLVVCTFTRKASQELKERLFEKALEEMKEESILEKLENKKNNYQTEDNFREKSSSRFLQYVQSPSLYIATIDGILNLFLKRYGHRFDLNPDFQLSSSHVNGQIFDSLAKSFLFEEPASLLQKLPYSYLKKLFLFYFNCRLKYGKVSFYNKKDFEDFQRDQMFFLRIKESLEKQKGKGAFLPDPFFEDQKTSLKEFFSQGQCLEDIKSFFNEEESFQTDHFVPLFEEFNRYAKRFFSVFLEKKKSSGFLDMEDLLLFSLALLRESPQTASDFSREWDYWLIDEYQDTSWMQEQIIHKITGFKNVFCVGDPGQSIYLFRSADPEVFKRREKAMRGDVAKRDTNHRSSPELVHFYNDFFPETEGFIKCRPSSNFSLRKEGPSIHFLTYNKESKEKYSAQNLKALQFYIQRLKEKGCSYSDIAILSPRNEDLEEIAVYLRNQQMPLALYSSKNFAQKRLIRDALFLLKFLINPFDNTNLKALLRTPYFRLSDQELADSSYEHYELARQKEFLSFWSFIKIKFSDKSCIRSLNVYLEEQKTRGLVKTFEKALMDSGLMEFSYLQDPTGSSEVNLWKSLYLLNKENASPLNLFYSLHEEKEEDFDETEAPSEKIDEALRLMTIHNSKGLEFKHVLIMDSNMATSSLRSAGEKKDSMFYDEKKEKMGFAAPIGGRDKKQIKFYAHKLYNKQKALENLKEKNRVFYVAMTRAKESLAVFIPNSAPEKNSWLGGVSFFKRPCFKSEESKKSLLEQACDPKKTGRLKFWKLNEGLYKTKLYSFCVQSVDSLCQSSDLDTKRLLACEQEKRNKVSVLTGGKKYFNNSSFTKTVSSKNFINEEETSASFSYKDIDLKLTKGQKNQSPKKESASPQKILPLDSFKEDILQKKQSKSVFSFHKEKNVLFKTYLGSQLHFFLQKLSFQPMEQVQSLIENSFLLKKEKEKIQEALVYIYELKRPPMKLFLERGFSEWPFKLKKEGILFQGQIDLWVWDDKDIRIFDYKSSEAYPDQIEKQLIFYSWILNELYHPKRVQMYAIYPFQKKASSFFYGDTEKSLVENWLEAQIKYKM